MKNEELENNETLAVIPPKLDYNADSEEQNKQVYKNQL